MYAQMDTPCSVGILEPMKKPDKDNLSFYENKLQNKSVAIVSIPLELGSDARGLAAAPKYLRRHGLEGMLKSLGCNISENLTIPVAKSEKTGARNAKHLHAVADTMLRAYSAVEKAAKRGDFVLALGGDNAISIGTISGAAAAYPTLGVIWIDAHSDCNTPETTMTGNIHGMPAATVMGFGDPALTGIGTARPKVRPENFLYIGLTDMDPAEIEFIRKHGIAAVTMLDIARRGLSPVTEAVDALAKKVDAVWVTWDIDSIDETFAPGVAMTSCGGLSDREALGIARYIGKTCRLAGIDIAEMLPAKDINGKTADIALELIGLLLGSDSGGYRDYMQKYEER